MKIIQRQAAHHDAIEELLDESFGKDRHRRISYAIREGAAFIPNMSLVMMEQQNLVATINCWPIYLSSASKESDDQNKELIMVGPIAVSQSHQNLGYGRRLVNKVIEIAKDSASDALVMIGDPEYYAQFGFVAMNECAWQLPGPYEKHRLLMYGNAAQTLPKLGILGPYPSGYASSS